MVTYRWPLTTAEWVLGQTTDQNREESLSWFRHLLWEITCSSLQSHPETQHNICRPFILSKNSGDVAPPLFLPKSTHQPVSTPAQYPAVLVLRHLRCYFVMRHLIHLVVHTPVKALSKGHTQVESCWDLCAWKLQHAAVRDSPSALQTPNLWWENEHYCRCSSWLSGRST
jgi:hypothetical protein